MYEDLPFYNKEWNFDEEIRAYFWEVEEGDVQNPLSERVFNLLFQLYKESSDYEKACSRQRLSFLLHEAPHTSVGREELCYFMLQPYLQSLDFQPKGTLGELKEINEEIKFMPLHNDFQLMFDDLHKAIRSDDPNTFDQHRYNARAAHLLRIDTILAIENDLVQGLAHDPEAYFPDALLALSQLDETENMALLRYMNGLSDRLLDHLNDHLKQQKNLYRSKPSP